MEDKTIARSPLQSSTPIVCKDGRILPKPFAKGNRGGPGNPHGKAINRFRTMLFACVTDEDFRKVVKNLVRHAKGDKGWAIRELLDRLLGKPKMAIEVTESPAAVEGAAWTWGMFMSELSKAALPLPEGCMLEFDGSFVQPVEEVVIDVEPEPQLVGNG